MDGSCSSSTTSGSGRTSRSGSSESATRPPNGRSRWARPATCSTSLWTQSRSASTEIVVTGKAAREGVAAAPAGIPPGQALSRALQPEPQRQSYARIEENDFRSAATEPLSTFSIDVDRASYANVRRFIRQGTLPPMDAVRIEELVNYFPYDDPEPKGDGPSPSTPRWRRLPGSRSTAWCASASRGARWT